MEQSNHAGYNLINFKTPELSDREKLTGLVLNELQVKVIELRLVELMNQLINLEFEEGNESAFNKQRAFVKGQLEELRAMLDASNAAKEAVKDAYAFSDDGSFINPNEF